MNVAPASTCQVFGNNKMQNDNYRIGWVLDSESDHCIEDGTRLGSISVSNGSGSEVVNIPSNAGTGEASLCVGSHGNNADGAEVDFVLS